jgi:hypothetical protein
VLEYKKALQHAAHVHVPVLSQLRLGLFLSFVGAKVGMLVGLLEGTDVGAGVGAGVGASDMVGEFVGESVGVDVGAGDGHRVGEGVGVDDTVYTTSPILISSPTPTKSFKSDVVPMSASPFTTIAVAGSTSHA